jgi:hypothetical protein
VVGPRWGKGLGRGVDSRELRLFRDRLGTGRFVNHLRFRHSSALASAVPQFRHYHRCAFGNVEPFQVYFAIYADVQITNVELLRTLGV